VSVETLDRCAQCACPVVPAQVWRAADAETRKVWAREGMRRYGGRELCAADYNQARKRDELVDHGRRTRSVRDVVEDWLHLADEHAHMSRKAATRVMAPRLGMSAKALEKALMRASRLGLLESAA